MNYSFIPMTEEEINLSALMEEGVYDFQVIKSERKISTAGNPMAKLTLNVWDKNGKIHTVYDLLIFSTVPFNIRKVKHFCDAVGLSEQYKKGQIPEALEGCSGRAKIIFQRGSEIPEDKLNGKPKGSRYPDKNAVEDYIISNKNTFNNVSSSNSINPEFNDELPF